jgi:diguanylate cyclase
MSLLVLVVEDEANLRENLVDLLMREGFDAVGAATGEAGLAQVKQQQPALILCDIKMAGMSGYDLLQELRHDPETANLPFIFLSGQASRSQIRQGMNLGADDYLPKPFQPEELIQAIHSRLQRQVTRLPSTPASAPASSPVATIVNQPSHSAPPNAQNAILQTANPPHDRLTNLPNRAMLPELLQTTLDRAREYNCFTALLSLNIMRFSGINAAYGFSFGDRVLHEFARRLQTLVGDQGFVIRTNGDEFAVILDNLSWEEEALDWAEQIWRLGSAPWPVDGRRIDLQLAIGGTYVQHGQSTPEQLLLQADTARRSCEKWGGQVPYLFHDSTLAAQSVEQRLLETDLARAIHQGEFQIHYQPQITLPQGQITGVEALLRWRHPYRGMVSPDRFITIAEEMGLILPIGEWVLRMACLEAKRWQDLASTPLKLSVNLSIRQLQQEDLADQITRILQAVDLHPCQLTLELTETNLMADIEQGIQTLQALRQLGIKIAIDDFGKGYSSLHYLSRLPIDILKIDQSFVRRLPDDSQAIAISNAIINLAHELNLDIIAEGVETERQVTWLRDHGCHIMQGHLYSPALPTEDFARLLQQDRNCA